MICDQPTELILIPLLAHGFQEASRDGRILLIAQRVEKGLSDPESAGLSQGECRVSAHLGIGIAEGIEKSPDRRGILDRSQSQSRTGPDHSVRRRQAPGQGSGVPEDLGLHQRLQVGALQEPVRGPEWPR